MTQLSANFNSLLNVDFTINRKVYSALEFYKIIDDLEKECSKYKHKYAGKCSRANKKAK